MALGLREWIDERTSVGETQVRAMDQGLPQGVGWLNTLGGIAVAMIAIQWLTGVFLAMYYSPHPDAAYESMRYVDHQLPLGWLVHGLHHYGASAIVVCVFLHLLRTYFQAAYKPPRELVWLLGVVLFGLILGFGFTGYLLPWDQKAYYATNVGTSIPGSAPLIGPIMVLLARGSTDVGAMTLPRLYAVHVLLLPGILFPVIALHVYLVWRKGPTPPDTRVDEAPRLTGPSFELQLFRTAVAILVVFGTVYYLALFHRVHLEFKANPADSTYQARPEWYYLWLFQFLNDFARIPVIGKLPDWVPGVIVPGGALLFLALAPWIDRSKERRPNRRPVMVGLAVVGVLAIIGLTIQANASLRANATPEDSIYGHVTAGDTRNLDPRQVATGRSLFAQCGACHTAYHDYSGRVGPDLSGYGMKSVLSDAKRLPEAQKLDFYTRFTRYVRGELRPAETRMPRYPNLSDADLEAIAAYLSQDPQAVTLVEHAAPRTR